MSYTQQAQTVDRAPVRRSTAELSAAGSPADIPGDYAAVLADLARSWRSESGYERGLEAIVRSATVAIPGVHRASISMPGSRRPLETVASTDDVMGRLDTLQNRLRQGPAVDAIRGHDPVRTDDLGTDPRWPALGPRAQSLGLPSVLSVHLYVIGGSLGALTLASARAGAFPAEAEQLGVLFAAHAAVALTSFGQEQGLRAAVAGRDVIGQAKGILMQRHRISADQAFAMLVAASQDTNIKVREVAEHVVGHLERDPDRTEPPAR